MSRLHFLLLGALVVCALSVINATDQQRRIFIEE
jgi:cell division protein FtsL